MLRNLQKYVSECLTSTIISWKIKTLLLTHRRKRKVLRLDSGFFPEVLCFLLRIGLILQNIVMIKSRLFPIKFLLVYQDSIVSTPWLLKIICWDCVYPWAAAYVYCEEGSICPALTPRLAKSRDKPHTHIVAVIWAEADHLSRDESWGRQKLHC